MQIPNCCRQANKFIELCFIDEWSIAMLTNETENNVETHIVKVNFCPFCGKELARLHY